MRRIGFALLAAVLFATAFAANADAMEGTKFFQANGGNIGCVILKDGARCDIRNHKWPTPPKPKSCPLDYGNGLSVGKNGRGDFTCAGDTVLGVGPKRGDGWKIRLGKMRCAVSGPGVRCVSLKSGHGFNLSRTRAKRF